VKLTADPGIRKCGAALFHLGELKAATTVRNPAARGHGIREAIQMAAAVEDWARARGSIDQVVIERPKVYPNGKTPGDPNTTLLPLLGVAYALAAVFPEAVPSEFESPRVWKGTVDGIECTRRVRERLTDAEFARIELPASTCAQCRQRLGGPCVNGERGCGADHVYDAVGIGLKHEGRFERKRVIPR
jgi:hypothetical protein